MSTKRDTAAVPSTTLRKGGRFQSTFAMCLSSLINSEGLVISCKSWTSRTRRPHCAGLPEGSEFLNPKLEDRFVKKLIIILRLALISSVLVIGASANSIAVSTAPSVEDDRSFTHNDAGIAGTLPEGWKSKPDVPVMSLSTP